MTIELDLKLDTIRHNFKGQDSFGNNREYDSFIINYTSGKRVYLSVIKNNIRYTTISKTMKFQDNKVLISFGKDKIQIGTYKEIA